MKIKGLMLLLAVLLSGCATSQKGEPTKRVVFIETNAQCGDCKQRLEGELNFEKGIIYSELDVDTKKLEIKYNSKKISLEEIKQKIAAIGYDADDVKAVETAQEKLPTCCQPGGHE